MIPPKTQGLTFMEFVEILTSHGYKSLSELEKMPAKPTEWSYEDWQFAKAVIAAGTENCTEEEVKHKFPTASKLFKVFTNIMVKTGLLIELQQIRKISEKDLVKELDAVEGWDMEWVNRK